MAIVSEKWNQFIPGPIQRIEGIGGHERLFIKRLDQIQSWADGNKYYKLKWNIVFALERGFDTIVSKGGMFSNHLSSLAHACSLFKLNLIGVVRSYGNDPDNPMLNELKSLSKEILFLSPGDYHAFNQPESELKYPGAMFIPEGGLNERAIRGAGEIIEECHECDATHIVIAGGTLGTACGLIASASGSVKIIVVPSWKGCTREYLEELLKTYHIHPLCEFELWNNAHFGGFAKYDRNLFDFMSAFTEATGIPLDPIYTGKMMYAITEKIKTGYFSGNDSILAIHSGGIQGVRGFAHRFPQEWNGYAELVVAPNPLKWK